MRLGGAALSCIAAAAVAGCAGTSGVSDALTAGALDQRTTGVAVIRAEILGHGCRGGSLTLGKKVGETFSAVATVQAAARAAEAGDDIMQVELPPGSYHVVNVACDQQAGARLTRVSLGNRQGRNLVGLGGDYRRAFATFDLKAGEIVNVGTLSVLAGANGSATVSVTPLPAASLVRFREVKPNLAGQMTTRLMTVSRGASNTDERRRICANLAAVRAATGVSGPVPADCPAETAPALPTQAPP